MRSTIVLTPVLLAALGAGEVTAAPFQNLDFEDAIVTMSPGSPAPPSELVPGWTISPNTVLSYDVVFLGAGGLSIHDGDPATLGFPITPLEGAYSLLLQGPQVDLNTTMTLGEPVFVSQTADIGPTATRIRLLASGQLDTLVVTLDGTPIPMVEEWTVGGATRLVGDISAFSGMAAHLTVGSGGYPETFLIVDDIVIPEPKTGLILACGLIALGAVRRSLSPIPDPRYAMPRQQEQ